MVGTTIQPTVTQQVRAFLGSQGAAVQAWSGLDETYAELYALLNRRRDDPTFWEPVRELLQEIVASSTDPDRPDRLPAAQAELLATWDVDQLVAELRAALPGGEEPVDAKVVQRFASKLSVAVMGGFLLLGLAAAGCGDGKCGAASSVVCSTIQQSKLASDDKRLLSSCVASLDTSWNDGLTSLFQTGTAEQIATVLNQLVQCCTDTPSPLTSSYDADAKDKLLRGRLCGPVPVYKGVSFPG